MVENNYCITGKGITKKFKNSVALNEISFQIKHNELFGFIGADGAGKTTLFRIIISLMLADSGELKVNGFDPVKEYRQIRNIVGYMPGKFSLYQDLSIEENLNFFATIFETTLEENYSLIKNIYFQIEPFKNRRAGNLSGGMKQKLALCCALIHKPKILILDEPTTGVDPVSRKEFWEILGQLKKEGLTIIVSTPYMDEAALCDRISFMDKGKILTVDTPSELINKFNKKIFAVKTKQQFKAINDLKKYKFSESVNLFGEYAHLITNSNFQMRDEIKEIEKFLIENKHSEIDVKPINPTIEDCFMELAENE